MKLVKKNYSSPPASGEQDPIRQSFRGQAEAAQVQQQLLSQHVESILARQSHWLGRIQTSAEERQMLETYWAKQNKALEQALQSRNASLEIIGTAQLDFIREVCDSLLITTRSQVQLNRSAAYHQRFLELNRQLEALNDDFFALVARKMEHIEQLHGRLRELQVQQLERMLQQWDQTYDMALEEFADIFRRRHTDPPEEQAARPF